MMNPFEEKPKSIKNYPMDWTRYRKILRIMQAA